MLFKSYPLTSYVIAKFGFGDETQVDRKIASCPENDDVSKEDELFRMVAKNQIDEVDRLLSAKPIDGVKGLVASNACKHDSLIHRAVRCGLVKMTDMLILRGICSVNDVKQDGATPLFIAAQEGHADLTRRLIFHGADLNLPDEDGISPLYIASYQGQLEIVNILLASGADPNKLGKDHTSPIYIAAQEGYADIVNALASNGANVNSADQDGTTPLLMASQEGRTATVAVLLSFGADVSAATSRGVRAVHTAAQNGHIKVLKLLCAYGADLNVHTKSNATSLKLARLHDRVEVVNWISTARHWKNPLRACVEANIHWVAKELFVSGKAGVYLQDANSAIELRKFCSKKMNLQPLNSHPKHTGEIDTATLIARATAPWCISNSSLYGPQMRELTLLLFLIRNRVCIASGQPILPEEMWLYILSFTTHKQLCKPLC